MYEANDADSRVVAPRCNAASGNPASGKAASGSGSVPGVLLVALIAVLTGCNSLRSSSSSDLAELVAKDPARVATIEDRYREEYEPVEKKKANGFDALAPANVKSNIKGFFGMGPDPKIARQEFAAAEALYDRALQSSPENRAPLLLDAAEKYTAAAERWPGSLLEEDGLFLAGEAYFFANFYPKAEECYAGVIKKQPNTKYLETIGLRRFAIAQFWLQMDQVNPNPFYMVNLTDSARPWYDVDGHAFRVFDRIRTDDPTGKLADDATMASANEYFRRGNYLKADDLYSDLRKAFPSSEHQFDAHFFGLKTKLLTYQGWDYSGDPLDQAENLVKQTRRQFPQKAEEEGEFLLRAAAETRFHKAERLWSLGHYYELKHEYRAATVYYQQLIKDYSDTPFAKDASDRIPTFAGKPPTPPQPLPWLANLFPARSTAKPLLKSDEAPSSSSKRR